MKLNTNTLLFFPLVANALPLTTRNPSAEAIENLLPRADNWCWLNADALVHQPQGCDSTPFDGQLWSSLYSPWQGLGFQRHNNVGLGAGVGMLDLEWMDAGHV